MDFAYLAPLVRISRALISVGYSCENVSVFVRVFRLHFICAENQPSVDIMVFRKRRIQRDEVFTYCMLVSKET